MKKIYFIIMLLLFIPCSSRGAVNIDLITAWTMPGDLENQAGAGAALSYYLNREINIFARGLYSAEPFIQDDENADRYRYHMLVAGIQHLYQITDTRVHWTNSLGAGMVRAMTSTFIDGPPTKGVPFLKEEDGVIASFQTGLLFQWTQYSAPYIEAGYQSAFFNSSMKNVNTGGIQFFAGVRFTFGESRIRHDAYY